MVPNNEQKNLTHENSGELGQESVTRRKIAKLVYIAPAVLAVIAASERPALAQSAMGPPQ